MALADMGCVIVLKDVEQLESHNVENTPYKSIEESSPGKELRRTDAYSNGSSKDTSGDNHNV